LASLDATRPLALISGDSENPDAATRYLIGRWRDNVS
jgi:hypothetical protein